MSAGFGLYGFLAYLHLEPAVRTHIHKDVLFELDLMHEWSSAMRRLREGHHGERNSMSDSIAVCP